MDYYWLLLHQFFYIKGYSLVIKLIKERHMFITIEVSWSKFQAVVVVNFIARIFWVNENLFSLVTTKTHKWS